MATRSLLKANAGALEWLLRLLDPLLVVGCGVLLHALQFGHLELSLYYQLLLGACFLACFAVFPYFDLYLPFRGASLWREAQSLAGAWAVVFAGLVMALFATKTSSEFSRLWIGQWALGGFAALLVFRMLLRGGLRALRRRGLNLRFVAIAGAGTLGREVARRLAAAPWTGLQVRGFYDDAETADVVDGVPLRGTLETLPEDVLGLGIDQVWIALPLQQDREVHALLRRLGELPVQVTFVPDLYGVQLLNHSIGEVAGFPVIRLMESPLSGAKGLIKSIEDRGLALLILLLATPLMLLIALGVKLSSPGPVFFRQLRGGLHGERIRVWKFRSMREHADKNGSVTQSTPGDPRVTRFGAFLRRSSLDELPQFFNVLRGEMSIVGPRPHAIEHDAFYQKQIESYLLRHHVKPGITGWAQVNGWRGETGELGKMEMRVRHDLYYINNWSLWFDLRIILMTLWMVVSGKNAH